MLTSSDHPRERGIAANDVTSFLPSQKEWGPDRDIDWPKVENNVLHRFDRQGYPIPDYKPEVWYDEGRIVLDMDNHAILRYEVIPDTLSSELSGRDMEAMKRLDLRISSKDLRARMPSIILTKDKSKLQKEMPLCTLSAIGMRATRFRKENGLISWTEREGGNNIRQYFVDRMPEENIAANSTQGMPVPTLFEQEDSRSKNRGQHLNRAGDRALSDDTRKERANKEQLKLEKLRVADIEAKKATVRLGGKRKREDIPLTTKKEPPRSKRTRQDFASLTSDVVSNFALPPEMGSILEESPQFELQSEMGSFPEESPQFELPPHSESLTRGSKRNRADFLAGDEVGLELPSKRHKAQAAHNQPAASFVTRPKASRPKASLRRPRDIVSGIIASGNPLPSDKSQIQRQPLVENRLASSASMVSSLQRPPNSSEEDSKANGSGQQTTRVIPQNLIVIPQNMTVILPTMTLVPVLPESDHEMFALYVSEESLKDGKCDYRLRYSEANSHSKVQVVCDSFECRGDLSLQSRNKVLPIELTLS